MRPALVSGLASLLVCTACSGDDSGDSGGDGPGSGDSSTADPTSVGSGDEAATPQTSEGSTASEPDSSGADTEGPGEPTLCWTVEALGVLAEPPGGMAVYDSDGDGSEELWAWSVSVDLSSTELTRLALGPEEVVTLPGAFVALADFDGDDNLDALMEDSPGAWSIYFGTGLDFGGAATTVDAPEGRIVGVFDLNGDGSADLVQGLTSNSLGGSLWMGSGVFATGTTLGVPAQTSMDAFPVSGSTDLFALRSQPAPGNRGCNDNRIDTLSFVGAALATSATGPMAQWEPPLAVIDVTGEGSPDVFVVACDGIPSVTNLRLLTDVGEGTLVESTVVDNVQWATVADVDGDGSLDVVWGDEVEGEMLVRLDVTTPEGTESTGVAAGTVEHNAVRVADLDGDGDQEILRAIEIDGEIHIDRIAVVDCD
ncbi:MAG: VCBS repeat-containing protein [Nannocystaceae bacterium]|nr:VCBS repeat-containing protein [Nannocystaceae bacterium]